MDSYLLRCNLFMDAFVSLGCFMGVLWVFNGLYKREFYRCFKEELDQMGV